MILCNIQFHMRQKIYQLTIEKTYNYIYIYIYIFHSRAASIEEVGPQAVSREPTPKNVQ